MRNFSFHITIHEMRKIVSLILERVKIFLRIFSINLQRQRRPFPLKAHKEREDIAGSLYRLVTRRNGRRTGNWKVVERVKLSKH